jgi:ribose transport system substrate-binding protein
MSGSSSGSTIASTIGKPTGASICAGGKTYKLGYDTFSDSESFAVQQAKALDALAKQLGCVTIVKLVDNANPTTAVQNARLFVQQKVDGVMTFNIIAAAAPQQIAILKAANIPVVSTGVQVAGSPFIAANESSSGQEAGSQVAKAFQAKHAGETPYVIVGRNDVVGKVGLDRMNGFVTGVESVVGKLDASHLFQLQTPDPSKAQSETLSVLGKVPAGGHILLMGINDDITYGMYQGVKSGGRSADAQVVGIGAVRPSGLNYVCQNASYIGAVGYFPEQWPNYMVPAIIAQINGETIPETIDFPTKYISRDELSTVYPDFKCGES